MLHSTSKKLWLLTLLVTMSVANAFADNVAKIGATEYETLQAAINAVPANTETTITLIGQDAAVSGNGFQIPDYTTGKNIIIDFNGCTYTVTGGAVGSTGTINQCMHFYKGNTLTLRNGTIKVQENLAGVKIMMQNYCDLTLDNFNVDCSNVITQTYAGYTGNDAVWNGKTRPKFNFNSGTSNITNSTITFSNDDLFGVLIDLEGGSAANLTIGEGTTINGNVTALGGNATINAGTITGNVSTDKVEADQAAGSIIINGGTVAGNTTAAYGTITTSVESPAQLKAAIEGLEDDNHIIKLTKTIKLEANIAASHSFTLNLGSYSITKGDYSISLDDGITVTTSKASLTIFSTSTQGKDVCTKKVDSNYIYAPAVAYFKDSSNSSANKFKTLTDAINYGGKNFFYLLKDYTLNEDVHITKYSVNNAFTISGDYNITNGNYRIYINKDCIGKVTKANDNLFATTAENVTLVSRIDGDYNTYSYVNPKEASIGNNLYDTFTAALDAAKENDVITLLRKVVEPYTMTSTDQTIKVRKNGYNITIKGYDEYVVTTTTDNDITTYTLAPASIVYTALNNSTPTYYEKLTNSLQSGTYKLLQDITATTKITTAIFGNDVTVDLNGHTLTNTKATDSKEYCFGLTRTNQKLTIKDSSEGKTGKVVANNCIFVDASGNELNVEAAIEVTGDFAVATNGSTTKSGTINIKEGAKLTSTVTALYLPGVVNATISGGTITGATAIYQKSGTLNITGGTITGNGAKHDFTHNGNGANATGDAVVVENCGYPGGVPQITISGGTFTSTNGKAVASYAYGEYKPVTGIISGGTYSSNVNDLVAEGKMAVQEDNTYKVYAVETNTTVNTAEELQQTMTVKDGNDTKQTITISVTPTSEQSVTAEGEVALEQVDMTSVIGNIIETSDFGTAAEVSVTVELQVNADVKSSDLAGDKKTITFEVKPEAVVKINNQAATAVELSNDNLAPNATFTFTLEVTAMGLSAGDQVKVVHKSIDPNYQDQDETFMATVWAKDSKQYVTITTTHFSEFEITNEAISANDDITLIDGTVDYNITSDVTVKSATYKRSFSAVKIGKYQSWFVPFDYTITAEDATKFNFFKINMIANSDTEGNAENVDDSKIWIHLKAMNVGETLYANKPYVIRPVEGEYTADEEYSFIGSTTLKAKDVGIVRQTATSVASYDFYGTYTNTESTKHHDFLYVSVNGQICWSIANWQYSVAPYRWIIRMTAKDGNYARTINFTENNSETTGISDVNSKSEEAAANYAISGQRVSTLKKGLYIVNGKKVIMK